MLARWTSDTAVLTRRNLWHVRREPMQLSDVTIQPVLFVFLFVYVFGAAMNIPGGSYVDFAIAGLLTLNLTTSSVGTAVGLSSDLTSGVINRFRTLPMARSSVLVGRSISDLLASALAATLVLVTGFVIGWRPDNSVLSVLGGIGIVLLFAYALELGQRLPRDQRAEPRSRPGRRVRGAVPALVRVERVRARRRACRSGSRRSPTGTRSAR